MTPSQGELGGRNPAKDPLRLIARPLLAYFDKRFQEVYDRIDDRINGLYGRVATEVETISEMTLVMQRFVDIAGVQVDDVVTRMRELCDVLEGKGAAPVSGAGPSAAALESAYALASVGRLHPGARVLHVATEAGDAFLPATLAALGYDVSTLDRAEGSFIGSRGVDTPVDCVLWLPGEPDQHGVDLVRKSLEVGGELVMSLRHAGAAGSFVDEYLRDWSVVEHRLVAPAGLPGWQAVEAFGATGGAAMVELVRAIPRT
ncbi:MAG: hypothetical protein ACRDZ3_07555 [Acidimicrobiia bacterium]